MNPARVVNKAALPTRPYVAGQIALLWCQWHGRYRAPAPSARAGALGRAGVRGLRATCAIAPVRPTSKAKPALSPTPAPIEDAVGGECVFSAATWSR